MWSGFPESMHSRSYHLHLRPNPCRWRRGRTSPQRPPGVRKASKSLPRLRVLTKASLEAEGSLASASPQSVLRRPPVMRAQVDRRSRRVSPLLPARAKSYPHMYPLVAGDRTRCWGRVLRCAPPDPRGREGAQWTDGAWSAVGSRVFAGEEDSSTWCHMSARRARNTHAGRNLSPAVRQQPLPGTPQTLCATGMRGSAAQCPCTVCNAIASSLF